MSRKNKSNFGAGFASTGHKVSLVTGLFPKQSFAVPVSKPPTQAVTPKTPAVSDAIDIVAPRPKPRVQHPAARQLPPESIIKYVAEAPPVVWIPPGEPQAAPMERQEIPTESLALPVLKTTSAIVAPAQTVTASPQVATKGLFVRIWEFFFGTKSPSVANSPANQLPPVKVAGELEDAAESLVKRARFGDQNAMAIIDLVGKNAKKGIPAAMKARNLIAAYIDRNPVGMHGELIVKHGNLTITHESPKSHVGSDVPDVSVRHAATHLAHGPTITHERVKQILSNFSTEMEKGAFLHGMRYSSNPTPSDYGRKVELAHRTGKALALAGKIQNVRQPSSYISAFDPVVGWELGE